MLIPYDRPRGSIHSLAHLETLSDCRSRILCVSDRTLYLLHNFASLDCTFFGRYAIELYESGFIPLTRSLGPDWELYKSVVRAFQLEVLDMTCDIEAGLLAVADAIRASGGGGCSPLGNPVVNCIVGLDDEQLLGPDDTGHGVVDVDSPPEGFATWAEYLTYKCQAAEFIWQLERKHMLALRNFDGVTLAADIVAPIIAGLAGILPAAMTPPGFAVFVASIVAIGIVAGASWVYMDQMVDEWDANHDDIVCALYNSGNSVQAVSALSNAIEDALQAIIAWGLLEPISGSIAELLGTAFGQLAGNGIVEPLFKSIASVVAVSADCSSCDEPDETACFRTHTFESDLEGWVQFSGNGVFAYDATKGKLTPGSAKLTCSSGATKTITVHNYGCYGHVIGSGWQIRYYVEVDGVDTDPRTRSGVLCTDGTFAYVELGGPDASFLTQTVNTTTNPELIGKTIKALQVYSTNGASGGQLDVWIDDIEISYP